MKKIIAFISLVLCLCMLAACAGTPVIYHINCDCPDQGGSTGGSGNNNTTPPPEGALKTGLALVADISGSKNGEATYKTTMIAVLVDDNGVIQACAIDAVDTSVKFNSTGKITSDLTAAIQSKNELGDNYKMPSGTWKDQAARFADYVIGKTAAQVAAIAVDESTYLKDSVDISSSVTMTVGSYISAIQVAVANASHLGAMGGDTLKLAATYALSGTDASTDKGMAQFDVNVTALTMKDDVITSCALDSVQAKVEFDSTGAITTDVSAPVKTKNDQGDDYMMNSGSWKAQAASFAKYVKGKTVAEVKGIAVDSGTKPTGSDLTSSVTIAIGGFQALIEKAAK